MLHIADDELINIIIFATWIISQGVTEFIVNTLQGRAPPQKFRILIEHYWEDLKRELKAVHPGWRPSVLCCWRISEEN
jgi:hypothetical protein